MRGGTNLPHLGIQDYEMRFTQRCADGVNGTLEAADCLGWRAFSDGSYMEIPFELWHAGVATPDDGSDDVRLVPVICRTNMCGGGSVHDVFDIGGDHPISGAADDPLTDWVYWYPPPDLSPGEGGHNAFFAEGGSLGHEIMARTVLVVHNAGSAPPYDPDMPEAPTVFRIATTKPNQPGDVYSFSTVGFGAEDPGVAELQERLDDIGMVPNPYEGASDYEVSHFTDEVRFTNMPDLALIRVFTLNGTLIKTIRKQSPGVATISWDMRTAYNLPVASGIYLVHVEVPSVGTKVIKFGVVKKRVQLNVF